MINENNFQKMLRVICENDSENIIIFDKQYKNKAEIIEDFNKGNLLVHARVKDGTNFEYGIDPSAGEFLKSTSSWQDVYDEYGDAPELIFFTDNNEPFYTYAEYYKKRYNKPIEIVFVKKEGNIQKSLGDGKVLTADGRKMDYSMSDMADYEDPIYRSEPAGVETGDWYTNESQDVVAVMDY